MMKRHPAFWTFDEWAYRQYGFKLYYFAPIARRAAPYKKQIHVEAIIDIADDGTLAGIEIISDEMPLPPITASTPSPANARGDG